MKIQTQFVAACLASLSSASAWLPEASTSPNWLRRVLAHSQTRAHEEVQRRAERSKYHKNLVNRGRNQKVNLRFLVDVVAKGLSKNDEDAFAALTALERIVQPTLMDSINQMRCEVCWKRPDILAHAKCVKFLTRTCKVWHNGGEKDGKVCPNVCKDLLELCLQNCWDVDHEKKEFSCDLYTKITGEAPPPPPGGAEPAPVEAAASVAPAPGPASPSAPEAPAAPATPGNRDGDASGDVGDAFPDDASEDKDSDGDGFGDNKDPWPLNPNCYHADQPCEEDEAVEPTIPMTQVIDPTTLNKVGQGLPSQGYDEHSDKLVSHEDRISATGDWGQEWPQWNTGSQADHIARICAKYPDSDWCILKTKGRLLRSH